MPNKTSHQCDYIFFKETYAFKYLFRVSKDGRIYYFSWIFISHPVMTGKQLNEY